MVDYSQCLGDYSSSGRALRRGAQLSCAEAERAGQFFRIWPDATISIARITDSDVAGGANGAHPETKTMQIVVD